jgi:hypothetical protein
VPALADDARALVDHQRAVADQAVAQVAGLEEGPGVEEEHPAPVRLDGGVLVEDHVAVGELPLEVAAGDGGGGALVDHAASVRP